LSVVEDLGAPAGQAAGNAFSRLYRGQTSFDFVGRWRVWFALSGLVILAGVISVAVSGFNFGIEFRGGNSWQVKSPTLSVSRVQDAMASVGLPTATVEVLGSGSSRTVEVQYNLGNLSQAAKTAKENQVANKLAALAGTTPNQVNIEEVGPTWGSQITQKAVISLVVFFVLIALYISFRFEPKMALAAIVAMVHDILVTAGIYSLSRFQVTPATVVAFLTILGYSLYDTVVVFDRVLDNTKGLGSTGRITYSEAVNLSMNQVLARSINTSLVAVLPILSVLLIGAQLLGATTLQEFGLALFIGLTSGAYSSIFIASPLLALLKERESRYAAIRQRLSSRRPVGIRLTPALAAAGSVGGPDGAEGDGRGERRAPARPAAGTRRPAPPRASAPNRPPPRPRKKGKRR